jgi:hypothetical protein
MIRVRRVGGSSMRPALLSGDTVVAFRRKPHEGDIVLARHGGREIIKRVGRREGDKYYLVGDNRQESTDSRHYGFISKNDILGTIMIILPKAVHPPTLVKPYGILLGRIAAAILVVMALVHLFRIDTLLPILDEVLPGGRVAASFMGVIIILSEVFALPFALRMKLSPLAHLVSGALLVLAPLWWFLIGIWGFGLVDNTGQLGQFVAVPANTLVLFVNLVWVSFSYYALYLLGYNNLKVSDLLRK